MHLKTILHNSSFKLLISLLIILILILEPETCLTGARHGLMLWFITLLPTLFPFFVITRLIIDLDLCPNAVKPYYPIFVGLLSGYPAGALICCEMNKRGLLSDANAQCLLIACNNASPAFLISYVNCHCLGLNNFKFIIWISVIFASGLTALLYHTILIKAQNNAQGKVHINSTASPVNTTVSDLPISSVIESIMMHSFETLVMIAGYVILLSILAAVLMKLPVSGLFAAVLSGILEVTTGCNLIGELQETVPLYIKSAAAAALCGFGGLSAVLQTNSAIRSSNLSIKKYTLHKIICGVISMIICLSIICITHPRP